MKKVILEGLKHPIKLWLDDIEDGALEQAKNLANLPFLFKHVAIMPDSHQGYGMPIGGVIATKGVVIPNAVGVDIGCGMLACKTSLTEISTDIIKKIMSDIRKTVPVGFEHHKKPVENNLVMPSTIYEVMSREEKKIDYQLGTLGGGNHFIEIQKGDDGHIWFMIHTGSRNFGKQVCDYYNKKAKQENKKWFSSIDPKHDLAFFPINSPWYKAYIAEMNFALEFAQENRDIICSRILEAFLSYVNCSIFEPINIHHNYARMENHFGQNVMVHRKGATSAKKDQAGIIPGSQGTSSYIVEGLGNKESFMSCSHGAGRKMSRTKAENTLDLSKEINAMNKQRIIHSIRYKNDLDEAPGAYKDIDTVMNNQNDLVKVLIKLKPLAVIKG